MARRPMKPCKHRGCGALVADGKSHCDQHAHEAVKWKSDAVRGNRHARGYGTAWDKIRQRILRRDSGLCQPCLQAGRVTVATAVDHVISKARGGTDHDENLQAICRDCHAAKTARERLR
ncbi:putative bacteriophage protein gp82 [Burkholderia pseudomallei]|uniref:Gp70 n=2 Tax=Stanholtvirus TaxID=1623297 RepID=Q8W6N0_9CAUD|nr:MULTISPECIES: HNH endonuclease [pseudomallei group]NP_536427.1 HNH endonuclease [Burkholderia phage phiE125]YP_001111150.1 HNH endonuclease [Burkholderia phage phi644-2]KGX74974.1 HNH endonuclease family protein [Burkholderia pseudomallei MSHR435]AAL40344.1 gp70 [Burkholderia phage phiE125]ABO60825.1 gp71 [Burkholderia phage phi644-2]AHE30497.1 HNH endonuclease family protein [Burkholderia pseudomallei NCTC 13178]AHE32742.1 HNH endonuclease family protein [Burkholderia pseudomallei NAU20B